MSLPLAVHQRLTLLADAAEYVAPSRAELVGMLIANANLDADELESSLLAYRRKTIGDVLPASTGSRDSEGAEVIQIAAPRPGRPRRAT